jgi:hypothetical protein
MCIEGPEASSLCDEAFFLGGRDVRGDQFIEYDFNRPLQGRGIEWYNSTGTGQKRTFFEEFNV